MNILLKVENVFYSPKGWELFKRNKKHNAIIKDISFDVNQGSVLGIVGESGSGKTTLAKVICGILRHEKGNIIFKGGKENIRTNTIQILFQNTNELINPLRKVGAILNEAYPDKKKLSDICKLLDIPENQFYKFGNQLSGGERQRVGLARILSAEPELLILDEPFSAQDPESQINFLELFKKIKEELGITIICISHDIKLLKQFTDNILVLFGGKIMEIGKTDKIMNSHRHPYTKFLIEAYNYKLTRADFGESFEKPLNVDGCPYYSRCAKRSDKCINSVDQCVDEGLKTYCNYPL